MTFKRPISYNGTGVIDAEKNVIAHTYEEYVAARIADALNYVPHQPAEVVIQALRELAEGYFYDPTGQKQPLTIHGKLERESIIAKALSNAAPKMPGSSASTGAGAGVQPPADNDCREPLSQQSQTATSSVLSATQRSEWVSVSDRLPEERIRVNTWDGLIVQDAFYGVSSDRDREDWAQVCWRLTANEAPLDDVTHWTPLPSAPIKATDGGVEKP